MKPFSLPEMKTSPRIDLSRAPCSARSTMAASSSSGRRPSEFWLSPSRSNTAQAMPCMSIENRQSRNALMSAMILEPHSAAALRIARALCPAVM